MLHLFYFMFLRYFWSLPKVGVRNKNKNKFQGMHHRCSIARLGGDRGMCPREHFKNMIENYAFLAIPIWFGKTFPKLWIILDTYRDHGGRGVLLPPLHSPSYRPGVWDLPHGLTTSWLQKCWSYYIRTNLQCRGDRGQLTNTFLFLS